MFFFVAAPYILFANRAKKKKIRAKKKKIRGSRVEVGGTALIFCCSINCWRRGLHSIGVRAQAPWIIEIYTLYKINPFWANKTQETCLVLITNINIPILVILCPINLLIPEYFPITLSNKYHLEPWVVNKKKRYARRP